MKLGLYITTIFITQLAFGQDTWVLRDSMNGPPKSVGAVFTLKDDAYFVSGLDQFGFKRSMYSYDISQDDWDSELSLGGDAGDGLNRGSAIAFNVGGYGFCGLGTGSVAYFKDLWKFDVTTNSWTQMADFEGTARREAVSFTVGDLAYVGTGQDENGLTNDFWKYDYLSNTWATISAFPGTARRDAVAISMGGQGYVGTGVDANSYQVDFWAYYPLTNSWGQKADFPGTPRHGSVGFGLFPSAFIAFGEDNTFAYKKDVWEYNYFGDVWTQRSNFPGVARAQAIAIVVKGRAFVGTGYNGILLDDFWEYTPILSVDESFILNVNVFPNPAINEFTIQVVNQNENLNVEIFNSIGQIVTSQFSIVQSSSSQFNVSFTNVTKGAYYIRLKDNQGSELCKSVLIQ